MSRTPSRGTTDWDGVSFTVEGVASDPIVGAREIDVNLGAPVVLRTPPSSRTTRRRRGRPGRPTSEGAGP